MGQLNLVLRATLTLLLTASMAKAGVNVLTFHNDNSRTGENLAETMLTPANVNSLQFGKLFTYALDGDVYTQPLYVSGLNVAHAGVRNVVFVATEHNSVYALDADSNAGSAGGVLWHVNLGPSATTPTPDFGNRYGGFTEISPEVGITGTPVIDAASATLYLDSFTHEGSIYIHRLHALAIASGAERPYSPVVVSASLPALGAGSSNGVLTFEPMQQLQRSALTLASNILYVPYTGYADSDPYHGWILGYNPANLRLATNYVFNTTPNSTVADYGTNAGEGGIWMGGCGLPVDAQGFLYFATGNGIFDATNGSGGTEFGDSFVKLSTAHGLSVEDYFAPYNQAYLASNDLDAGSGGLLLLPNQPGPTPHIMMGGGKPGVIYVINRDNFTTDNNHYNTNGDSDAVMQSVELNGGIYDTPAYFNGTVYFTPTKDVTAAFSVSNGMISLPAASVGSRTYPFPGATASVSARGGSNGILWLVERATPAILVADDAADVSDEIYNSDQAGLRDELPSGTKFSVPTVANGKVFVSGQSALSVFGILPFTNTADVGTYCGLFYSSNGVQIGQSGYLTVTISTGGHYVARLYSAAGPYSFMGQFDGTGGASNITSAPKQSPLQLQLQLVQAGGPALTGTVGNGSWTAGIAAYEATYNARTNPAPLAGKYTLIINGPNDGNPQEPQGDGFGTVSISTAGQLVFHGTLADGTVISQTTIISPEGQWPVYSSLYAGRGQILGWVDFTNSAPAELGGDLLWLKQPIAKASSYPGGFDLAPVMDGSHFIAGTSKAPVLDFSPGVLILTAGGLPATITDSFTVSPAGAVPAGKELTLQCANSSGLFTGTAPNPLGGRAISFKGAFLTGQNFGAGYFIDAGLSGKVYVAAQ